MKKLATYVLILTFAATFAFTSCGGKVGGMVEGESFKTEGWVDENTLRIAASGIAKKTLTNKIARRESAKRAAMLNAIYQVLEKVVGAKTEGAAGMKDFEMTGIAIAQEVKGTIRGGSVVKATYDKDDNCEVIYEIKARGLKKMIMEAKIK